MAAQPGAPRDRASVSGGAPDVATQLPSTDELYALVTRELGPDLEIIRPLNSGGFATTFLAREPRLARLVVLKVLSPRLPALHPSRARFERAARAAAALHHPNLVTTYRFGYLSNDTPYLVLRHIKGVPLDAMLSAEGVPPVVDATRMVAEIADALAALHRLGFIHRDLRTGVIVREEETGRPVLTEFPLIGLLPSESGRDLRVTVPGEVLVAPDFASPEQLRGEEASEATDVYSLAVLAYHLLAGEGPFFERTPAALAAAHLGSAPRQLRSLRPEVDDDLADLLERCLAKEPGRRPRAVFLAEALRRDRPARKSGFVLRSMPDRVSRRLCAVWFADIVDFVRASSTNERMALDVVRVFQQITEEVVTGVGGVVVKFIGDGALARFGSTELGLRAALELQRDFGPACIAAGLAAELRIGMHLGDIAAGLDSDIYGEGVNIAARLTAEAPASSILVSADVWRQLRRRDEFAFEFRGEKQLKGVDEPLAVYEAVFRGEGARREYS